MKYLDLISGVLVLGLAITGCGQGKKGIPGIDDFTVSILKQRLHVAFVATRIHWNVGATFPVPGLGDATLSIAPHLSSDGTVFQFQVGISTIVNKGEPLSFSGLPDGRPLPDVVGGQMPRWDAPTERITLSLYLSDDAFAVFIPLDLAGLTQTVSIFIEDEQGNRLGKAYAVPPPDTRNEGGIFLLLPFIVKPQNSPSREIGVRSHVELH
jgi:hypothetical protein